MNDSLEFLVLPNFSLSIFRKSDSILLYVYIVDIYCYR